MSALVVIVVAVLENIIDLSLACREEERCLWHFLHLSLLFGNLYLRRAGKRKNALLQTVSFTVWKWLLFTAFATTKSKLLISGYKTLSLWDYTSTPNLSHQPSFVTYFIIRLLSFNINKRKYLRYGRTIYVLSCSGLMFWLQHVQTSTCDF